MSPSDKWIFRCFPTKGEMIMMIGPTRQKKFDVYQQPLSAMSVLHRSLVICGHVTSIVIVHPASIWCHSEIKGSYFSCKCPLMTNDERLIETSVKKTNLLFFPFSTPRISKSFCERIVVNLQLCNLKLKRNN